MFSYSSFCFTHFIIYLEFRLAELEVAAATSGEVYRQRNRKPCYEKRVMNIHASKFLYR